MKHTTSKEKVFDFSLYLFPHFLKKALRQGVYREYQTRHYNDANVRGTIEVNRHLRINMPFAGNIAYRTREYLHDNDTTQLIRHTIEHIRCHKWGGNILSCDAETKDFVSQITQVTESYQKNQRQTIINRNLKPVRHSLYTEYEPLRKLCLQILRHEHLKYGQKKDEIYGVLFDGAWLWEEYLGIVLKESFNHYLKGRGKRWKLFDRGQQIVPDYISKKGSVVADAKYIPLDGFDSTGNDEKATAIYYKTITYMYRFNSKIGLLLYPFSNHDTEIIKSYRILETEGQVIKVGFPIPKSSSTFAEFSEKMKYNETIYVDNCKKYIN
jgi:5-methylcytosine-specific restriction endonuclease McrBC regulatory subunit McrC